MEERVKKNYPLRRCARQTSCGKRKKHILDTFKCCELYSIFVLFCLAPVPVKLLLLLRWLKINNEKWRRCMSVYVVSSAQAPLRNSLYNELINYHIVLHSTRRLLFKTRPMNRFALLLGERHECPRLSK